MKEIKSENFYTLHYSKLNDLVTEFYGFNYDYIASLDGRFANGVFRVESTEAWSNDESIAESIKDWKDGGWPPAANDLLFQMAEAKFIPEGKYLVEIMW